MIRIHTIGFMGAALIEVDAEMAVEIVVADGRGTVGHAVHGSGIHMAVVLYQNRPAAPAPAAAVNGFHGGGIGSGFGYSNFSPEIFTWSMAPSAARIP